MTIEEQLTSGLKEAMREGRKLEREALRMVKTLGTKARSEPGFSGEMDDAFWIGVIGRYVKQQKKALAEYEKHGEAAAERVDELRAEIEYLAPFLPAKKGEDEVRRLVDEAIAELGAAGPKMVGRVVGAVMRGHRDEVEPAMVKRIAAEKLG
jgi:uncharacterized protein